MSAAALPRPSASLRLAPARPAGRISRPRLLALGVALALHVLVVALIVHPPALLARMVAPTPPPPPPPPPRQAEIEMVQNDMAASSAGQPIGGKQAQDTAHPAHAPDTPPPASPPPPSPDLPVGPNGEAPPPQAAPEQNAPKQPGPPAPDQKRPEVVDPRPAQQPTPQAPTIRLSDGLDDDGLSGGTAETPATPDPRFPNHKPAYPQAAAARGEHGLVVGLVNVNPDGTAGAVIVVQSSGSPTLDTTAVKAWQKWHFKPATDHGQPVTSQVPVQLDFVLHS